MEMYAEMAADRPASFWEEPDGEDAEDDGACDETADEGEDAEVMAVALDESFRLPAGSRLDDVHAVSARAASTPSARLRGAALDAARASRRKRIRLSRAARHRRLELVESSSSKPTIPIQFLYTAWCHSLQVERVPASG
jgi:hypothetical protein